MIDAHAKTYPHDDLRWVRESLLSKLDGVPEHDLRRPLATTGTDAFGSTPTRRSTRSPSTHPATCRGGRGPT